MSRLTCPTCGAGRVPAWTGLLCPLLDECGPTTAREVLGLAATQPPGEPAEG